MPAFEYRRLGNFTYHTIDDPAAIRAYLLKCMVAEWESDHREAPDEPWTLEWLACLPRMRFSLQILRLSEIRPRDDLMRHQLPGYSFAASLEQRADEREESILHGCSIGPLLVDGARLELMDGYVRYTVLCRWHERLAYAYVGREVERVRPAGHPGDP